MLTFISLPPIKSINLFDSMGIQSIRLFNSVGINEHRGFVRIMICTCWRKWRRTQFVEDNIIA